jgi:predicted DNA-binding antitoxin AbrB/MazE fold protein
MPLEVEATYENGTLKLDKPLPLTEHQRVTVRIEPIMSQIRQAPD